MNPLAVLALCLAAAVPPTAGSQDTIVVPKVELGDQPRPNLAVRIDGAILAGPRVLVPAGATDEGSRDLLLFLADASSRMPRTFREELETMAPAEALTVRCDENAPFASLARIARAASMKGLDIARLELPVRTDAGAGEQDVVEYETPVAILDSNLRGTEAPESFLVRMRVAESGKKLEVGTRSTSPTPWNGAPGSRFEYDASRRIEFVVDALVTDDLRRAVSRLESLHRQRPDVEIVRIATDDGVTFAEVLRFYLLAHEGFDVDFTLASE